MAERLLQHVPQGVRPMNGNLADLVWQSSGNGQRSAIEAVGKDPAGVRMSEIVLGYALQRFIARKSAGTATPLWTRLISVYNPRIAHF